MLRIYSISTKSTQTISTQTNPKSVTLEKNLPFINLINLILCLFEKLQFVKTFLS